MEKAKAITSVAGGVGPMTFTMLMVNTVNRLVAYYVELILLTSGQHSKRKGMLRIG